MGAGIPRHRQVKPPMKKILFLLSLVLLVASCRKENDRPILPLRLGEEDAKELQLTQSETRMILLKGGDGKYTATIEDARIASSSISRDTLRVSGLLYGETSLTLRSHDEVRRVRVLVVPPPFASNEDAVTLRPGDDVQTLSLSGEEHVRASRSKIPRRQRTSSGKPRRVWSRSRPSTKGTSS